MSRGPVLLYNGQEVGEPGVGSEGFGSDDSRTSIFDYWSMPQFTKWVNSHKYDGGRLSDEQKQLRSFYGRLINLLNEPALRDGTFTALNAVNRENTAYGRLPNEQASGHWFYSFMRYDSESGQQFIVAVNLSPTSTLKDIRVHLPPSAFQGEDRKSHVTVLDRLNVPAAVDLRSTVGFVQESGVPIAEMPPLSACYLELKTR
jgi:hypothetical protein